MKHRVMHIGEVESAKLLETMQAVAYMRGRRDGMRAAACGVAGGLVLGSLLILTEIACEKQQKRSDKKKDKKES